MHIVVEHIVTPQWLTVAASDGNYLQREKEIVMRAIGLTIDRSAFFPKLNWLKAIPIRFVDAIQAACCSWQFAFLSISTYLTIIATVAIYDIQLTIRYAVSLKQYEQNPIGRWLMNLDRIDDNAIPDVTLFLALKAVGTIAVLVVITGLVQWRGRVGHPVGIGVSTFQFGLACYLTYVESNE